MRPTMELRVITYHHYELGSMFMRIEQKWIEELYEQVPLEEWRIIPEFDENKIP